MTNLINVRGGHRHIIVEELVCMSKETTILKNSDLVHFDSNGRIVAVKMYQAAPLY